MIFILLLLGLHLWLCGWVQAAKVCILLLAVFTIALQLKRFVSWFSLILYITYVHIVATVAWSLMLVSHAFMMQHGCHISCSGFAHHFMWNSLALVHVFSLMSNCQVSEAIQARQRTYYPHIITLYIIWWSYAFARSFCPSGKRILWRLGDYKPNPKYKLTKTSVF